MKTRDEISLESPCWAKRDSELEKAADAVFFRRATSERAGAKRIMPVSYTLRQATCHQQTTRLKAWLVSANAIRLQANKHGRLEVPHGAERLLTGVAGRLTLV
jgi:hypothetical protein